MKTKNPFKTKGMIPLLFLALLAPLASAQNAQPNILWIIAEDMGPELSCYGTPEVKTPALDQLAAMPESACTTVMGWPAWGGAGGSGRCSSMPTPMTDAGLIGTRIR